MNLFYSLKFTPLCKFMLQCTCIAQSLDHTWVEQSRYLSGVRGSNLLVSCWTQEQTRAGWYGFQSHLGQLIFIKNLSLIFSVNTRCCYLLEPIALIPLYRNVKNMFLKKQLHNFTQHIFFKFLTSEMLQKRAVSKSLITITATVTVRSANFRLASIQFRLASIPEDRLQ